jgi:myosin-crossreactive antigen
MSSTLTTTNKRVIELIEKVVQRGVFTGGCVTAGPVTIRDSK